MSTIDILCYYSENKFCLQCDYHTILHIAPNLHIQYVLLELCSLFHNCIGKNMSLIISLMETQMINNTFWVLSSFVLQTGFEYFPSKIAIKLFFRN